MESIEERFIKKIDATSLDFIRSIIEKIRWDARLIGIKGSRGVGKTTLLLQYIKTEPRDKPYYPLCKSG
jgi:uncharacterized protein